MSLNFYYAAHTYVDNWVVCDREARKVLGFSRVTPPEPEQAREHLIVVAKIYGIARNFRLELEGDKARLSPVWTALQEIEIRPISEPDAIDCVNNLVNALKPTYGRELLSAASKILWMRFGHPIIIYDSLTWKWMCQNGGCPTIRNYGDFYKAWRTNFDNHQNDVVAACEVLKRVKARKFLCPIDVTDEEFEDAVSSPWFAERVFDHAVVNEISGV